MWLSIILLHPQSSSVVIENMSFGRCSPRHYERLLIFFILLFWLKSFSFLFSLNLRSEISFLEHFGDFSYISLFCTEDMLCSSFYSVSNNYECWEKGLLISIYWYISWRERTFYLMLCVLRKNGMTLSSISLLTVLGTEILFFSKSFCEVGFVYYRILHVYLLLMIGKTSYPLFFCFF